MLVSAIEHEGEGRGIHKVIRSTSILCIPPTVPDMTRILDALHQLEVVQVRRSCKTPDGHVKVGVLASRTRHIFDLCWVLRQLPHRVFRCLNSITATELLIRDVLFLKILIAL